MHQELKSSESKDFIKNIDIYSLHNDSNKDDLPRKIEFKLSVVRSIMPKRVLILGTFNQWQK